MNFHKLINGKTLLAPMAGYTNVAFRALCRKHGAAAVCTEMVNASAVCRGNKSTLRLAETCEEERPVGIQLFGSKIDMIEKAAKMLEQQADFIDFNFGCPDKRIVDQGAGAALLKRPAKIKEIVSALVSAVDVPVTAKVRIGFNKEIQDPVKTAQMVEEGGAAAITVHARTGAQRYSGEADWGAIKQVKDAVSIQVIGNGDVIDGPSAQRMMDETGCDYVMIGRAAAGDPMIFERVNHFLDTGELLPEPGKKEKIKMLNEYLELAKKFELTRFQDVKIHAHAFMTGFKEASRLRTELNKCTSLESLLAQIDRKH